MNKEIKKKWIAALKSGKFKQGSKKLRYGNQNGTFHCCLGVLSELALKEGVCSNNKAFQVNETLSEEVQKWAGLYDDNPNLGAYSAALYNDGDSRLGVKKCSFEEIANKIQRHL